MMIEKFIDFAKGQQAYHTRQVERFPDDPTRASQHRAFAEQFADLATFLEQQQAGPSSEERPRERYSKLGDLSDLPPELLKELNISDSDQLERQILELADELDGEISVDEILIGLYRRFKVVQQRKILVGKLSRMLKKGSLISVAGRKGVYRVGDRYAMGDDDDEDGDVFK